MPPLWLKSLPWAAILSKAPVIVDGAKKLVQLVKSKPAAEEIPRPADASAGESTSELEAMRTRIRHLEEEQRQAAELVRAMAESQAQMAEALKALRARARLNLGVAVISLIGVVALVLLHLMR